MAVSNSSNTVVVYDTTAGYLTAGDMLFQNGGANFGLTCNYAGNLVVNSTVVVSCANFRLFVTEKAIFA